MQWVLNADSGEASIPPNLKSKLGSISISHLALSPFSRCTFSTYSPSISFIFLFLHCQVMWYDDMTSFRSPLLPFSSPFRISSSPSLLKGPTLLGCVHINTSTSPALYGFPHTSSSKHEFAIHIHTRTRRRTRVCEHNLSPARGSMAAL